MVFCDVCVRYHKDRVDRMDNVTIATRATID